MITKKLSGRNRLGQMEKKTDKTQAQIVSEYLSKSSRLKEYNNWKEPKSTAYEYYIVDQETIWIPNNGFILASHEIAHIIEMNDNSRIVQNDFGMELHRGKKTINYFLPAIAREARVRMIEMIMTCDNPHQDMKTMGTFNPLNNSMILHGLAEPCIGQGKFKTLDDLMDWVEQIQATTLKNWNLDRIHSVWNDKVEFIENHFATKKMAA